MAAKKHHSAQDEEKRTKWTVERGSATVKIYLTPHGAKNYYSDLRNKVLTSYNSPYPDSRLRNI
jgi:hypothetical protein